SPRFATRTLVTGPARFWAELCGTPTSCSVATGCSRTAARWWPASSVRITTGDVAERRLTVRSHRTRSARPSAAVDATPALAGTALLSCAEEELGVPGGRLLHGADDRSGKWRSAHEVKPRSHGPRWRAPRTVLVYRHAVRRTPRPVKVTVVVAIVVAVAALATAAVLRMQRTESARADATTGPVAGVDDVAAKCGENPC